MLEIHATIKEAKIAEIRLIAEHKTYAYEYPETGYNTTHGGDGSGGHKRSEATKVLDRRPKLWRRGDKHPMFGKPAHNRGKKTPLEVRLK